MALRSGLGTIGTAAVLAGLLTGCDSAPTSPTLIPDRSPGRDQNSTVTRLELNAPDTIALGDSVQLKAVAHLSNGTMRDASNEVRWSTTNGSLIRISSSGLATGMRSGEARISIWWQNAITSSKEIVATPAGTFRVMGVITEDGAPGATIPDARVDVIDGATTVTGTTTDWNGQYRLYGVPPAAEIRVTKSGYESRTRAIQISGHATADFQLALSGVRADLAGTYRMTIDVECTNSGSRLAEPLRRRTYVATLTQDGASVEVQLSGSAFAVNSLQRGNHFTGKVDSRGATFQLGSYDSEYYYGPAYYPDVVERLDDSTLLVVAGHVTAGLSGNGLSGTLDGWLVNYDAQFPQSNRTLGWCNSPAHRFELTRVK